MGSPARSMEPPPLVVDVRPVGPTRLVHPRFYDKGTLGHPRENDGTDRWTLIPPIVRVIKFSYVHRLAADFMPPPLGPFGPELDHLSETRRNLDPFYVASVSGFPRRISCRNCYYDCIVNRAVFSQDVVCMRRSPTATFSRHVDIYCKRYVTH